MSLGWRRWKRVTLAAGTQVRWCLFFFFNETTVMGEAESFGAMGDTVTLEGVNFSPWKLIPTVKLILKNTFFFIYIFFFSNLKKWDLKWDLFLCVCSSAISHHSELPAVFAVAGDVLLVLHPLGRLHWEQGLHQRQHAALHCGFCSLRLTSDPGEVLLHLYVHYCNNNVGYILILYFSTYYFCNVYFEFEFCWFASKCIQHCDFTVELLKWDFKVEKLITAVVQRFTTSSQTTKCLCHWLFESHVACPTELWSTGSMIFCCFLLFI